MSAEENVEKLIEQFTLAQGELLKGNSEPARLSADPSPEFFLT